MDKKRTAMDNIILSQKDVQQVEVKRVENSNKEDIEPLLAFYQLFLGKVIKNNENNCSKLDVKI